MSGLAHYTPYHPKWYRRPVSVWWWLEKASYTQFVLRELTSVAVGYFALLTLWEVRALVQGPAAHARFLARLQTPAFLVLNFFAFVFVLFHSITWFRLAPKAIVVTLGDKRVHPSVLVAINYFFWVIISLAVAWFWPAGRP